MNYSLLLRFRPLLLALSAMAALALCVGGFVLGRSVPFAQQWPLFEALRNTAAIIFAVVGAWLAIIFPERLREPFGKGSGEAKEGSAASIRILLTPAFHSTAILVVLLLVGLLAPLVKPLEFVQANVWFFRGSSYTLLAALTCWQILIVVLAMFPAEAVQSTVNKEVARASINAARNRVRQQN